MPSTGRATSNPSAWPVRPYWGAPLWCWARSGTCWEEIWTNSPAGARFGVGVGVGNEVMMMMMMMMMMMVVIIVTSNIIITILLLLLLLLTETQHQIIFPEFWLIVRLNRKLALTCGLGCADLHRTTRLLQRWLKEGKTSCPSRGGR